MSSIWQTVALCAIVVLLPILTSTITEVIRVRRKGVGVEADAQQRRLREEVSAESERWRRVLDSTLANARLVTRESRDFPTRATAALPRPTDRVARDVTNLLRHVRARWCRLNLWAFEPSAQVGGRPSHNIVVAEYHRPWLRRQLENADWHVVTLTTSDKPTLDMVQAILGAHPAVPRDGERTRPCRDGEFQRQGRCRYTGQCSEDDKLQESRQFRYQDDGRDCIDIAPTRDRDIWCISDAPLDVRACIELLAFRYLDNLKYYTGPKDSDADLQRWTRHVTALAQWQSDRIF